MIKVTAKCPADHPCPIIRYCPTDAISQKGFGIPDIDKKKCTSCGACLRMCPYGAMEIQ